MAPDQRPQPQPLRQALTQWARPNVSVLGYALYLAINATSLWGGVFPFFPDEFRTSQVTFSFVISQALAFLFMFLSSMASSYRGHRLFARSLPMGSTITSFFGSALLIAALYLSDLQIALVVLAGVCLGVGAAGFALAWQRYFSSLSATYGNYFLLLGTACGSIAFFVLYLVPIAVTVYLVPLVLVPLCGLSCVLADRAIDLGQPLFEDVPSEHPRVYLHVIRDYWRGAVAIGSLGFISGLIRAVLLSNAALGNLIIVFSMVGALLVSVVLLWIWRRGAFALDMRTVFLVLFPLTALGLLAFPFLGSDLSPVLAGALYAVFTLASLVMLLQCMQISRDRGINPLFVFGFFGSIIYLMQDVGLTLGYATNITVVFGPEAFLVVALAGMFVLGMALYLMRGDARPRPTVHAVEKVEFIGTPVRVTSRGDEDASEGAADAPEDAARRDDEGMAREDSAEVEGRATEADAVPEAGYFFGESATFPSAGGDQGSGESLEDDLAARCHQLQRQYLLTNRETEIMELFAHGYSMPHIAELLVVSENTVRTHSKHLYAKLGIHKRQELIELLQ
ncbi:MAG: LuxR family transcriptional regulator [Eggerthellaceae bacterium]|nr:LuxR family transcriptional regulator [Eggerthellaceae bacterium]